MREKDKLDNTFCLPFNSETIEWGFCVHMLLYNAFKMCFFLSWKHKVFASYFLKRLWLTLWLVPRILSLKSRMFLFKSLLLSGANSIYKFFFPFSLLAEAVFKGHLSGNWFCCRWYFPNIIFCSYLNPSNVPTFLPKTFMTLTILRKEVKKNNPRIKNFVL